MRVTTGRVDDGRIEVSRESLAEGEAVIVLALEGDETFTLDPQDEAALLAAIAEGDRGDVISAEKFFCELGRED